MATKRGGVTAKRLVASVLVPSMVAFGVLVAVAAPASAEPVTPTPSGSAVSESAAPTLTVDSPVTAAPETPTPAAAEPTITITTAFSNTAKTTISGTSTGVAGRRVTVYVNSRGVTGTILPTGDWSVALFMPEGHQPATAVAWSESGIRTSFAQQLTIDRTAPTIDINGLPVSIYSHTPTISGRTDLPAGSSVTVAVDGVAHEVVVAPHRTWSITVPRLKAGLHTVVASAIDSAGNASDSKPRSFRVVPELSIDGAPYRLTTDTTPTISGTTDAPAGTTVTVWIAGTQTLIGTVTAAGTWSVTASPLPDHEWPVGLRMFDEAGNVVQSDGVTGPKPIVINIDTEAPVVVIDGGLTKTTMTPTPTISGLILSNPHKKRNVPAADYPPAGSSIDVAVDGVAGTAILTDSLTWSLTSPRLTAGTHTVVVSATDPAGNVGTSEQSITVLPPISVLSIDGGASLLTKNATPTISGKTDAPAGTVVRVTGLAQTLSATVTAAGTWSVTAHPLTSAEYSIKATVGDDPRYARTAWQKLTVDTIAPAIVIDGGSAVSTKTAAAEISGRVNVPAGSKITVVIDDVGHEVVVSPKRTWSVTSQPLKAGAHTVVAFATDAAGNVGTQRQRLTIVG